MPDTTMTNLEFTYTWTACVGVLGAAGLAFLVVAALFINFTQRHRINNNTKGE
jgi:hypothetical protein